MTCSVSEVLSIAAIEGSVKILMIDLPAAGVTESRIGMLCYKQINYPKFKSLLLKSFFLETVAGNLVADHSIDCDVIERGGRHFGKFTNVRTKTHFESLSWKFESNSTSPLISATINRVVKANWRLLYKEVEPHWERMLTEMMESVFEPIFSEIPIQDFFQCSK